MARSEEEGKAGAVMVMGAGIAGIQASLDLAESGFLVYLVETSTAIGGVMAQLDKTFPTNDCAMCILSPKLVEVGRHPNIRLLTSTQVQKVEDTNGNFKVTVHKTPRYIDASKCTGCGDCTSVCPVVLPNEYEQGLTRRKAIYKRYMQAVPGAFAIQKADKAPCRLECPAGINVQGYVQMVAQGKYREALGIIMQVLPLPGVIGRICPHPCQRVCRRGEVDEAVAIRDLKRLAADMVDPRDIPIACEPERKERVAIIGSGPAGLSAAYHLAKRGVRSTIYEALSKPGGMLRVGIPAYRLPREVLDREIEVISNLGVEIKTSTPLGRGLTIDDLFAQGYQAVYIAVGAIEGMKLGISGEETEGVRQGVDFLREVNLHGKAVVGKRVAIVGGGNVAIDVARSVLRLGAEEVNILYRRTREEMPASEEEVQAAEAEGATVKYLTAPEEVLTEHGVVVGLRCMRMEMGAPDSSGRRSPVPVYKGGHEIGIDQLIVAIGQRPALSGLKGVAGLSISRKGTIEADPITYATGRTGVFAGGDVQSGPGLAIGAIAAGREAAESMVRYLDGRDMAGGRTAVHRKDRVYRPIPSNEPNRPRMRMPEHPVAERRNNFREVALGYNGETGKTEAGRCLNCGYCCECFQCVEVCEAGAVTIETHREQAQDMELTVGAVILAPGFRAFDPSRFETYGYAKHPNIVTSMEFERLLSASGPTQGHLVRLSDQKIPKKIAWVQCVGSRNINACDHGYCSSVCCMYAIKEAVIAKEHSKAELDCAIFFMDMRTAGKGFETYQNEAEREQGVRFIRCRPHSLEPVPQSDDVLIRYVTEQGEVVVETFDMAVLSVGMEMAPEVVALARKLGIQLTKGQFCETDSFHPVSTSRDGIYVCGAFQGPKDIPASVMEASAAAGAAMSRLATARHSLIKAKGVDYPAEKEVGGKAPRIGVFVCHCGINIGGTVDVSEVRDYAAGLPDVVVADSNLFTCSQDTQEKIKQYVSEYGLNRVVVASCTPRTHEPMFRETLRAGGLNKYTFEMANIRDQCSWVHMHEPERATQKAKDLVRMAVAKARLIQPLDALSVPMDPHGLVIGGGVAGMISALDLAEQGFKTHLVERSDRLGGRALELYVTSKSQRVRPFAEDLVWQVTQHPLINIHLNTTVKDASGYVGNFRSTLLDEDMQEKVVSHGITILATGGKPYEPDEYLYGKDPRVMLSLELDAQIANTPDRFKEIQSAVFIQCVGSRTPERPWCSKVCCTHAIQSALILKALNRDMAIYILYRDIRTTGEQEDLFAEARAKGILFIRFTPAAPPRVEKALEELRVTVTDHVLQRPIEISPNIMVLATAILPRDNSHYAKLYKVSTTQEGFFLEAHMKLRPVEFATDGVFLAGLCHYPKSIEESIAQAKAAAARAASLLTKETIEMEPIVSVVDAEKCNGCGICERVCPYGAIHMVNVKGVLKAENIPASCKGCGLCAASCPSKAMDMCHFSQHQIRAQILATA